MPEEPHQSWTLGAPLSLLTHEVRAGSSWASGASWPGPAPLLGNLGKQLGWKANVRQWAPQGTAIGQKLGPACDQEGDLWPQHQMRKLDWNNPLYPGCVLEAPGNIKNLWKQKRQL